MYKNIFDTHAHYEDEQFDCDRDELLSSFPENGISGVVTCGTDIITSEKSIALAEKYPFIYAAVGFHALNLDSLTADWCGDIKKLAAQKKVVAIGEIGLDYHYERDSREKQLEVFEKQLVLANELSLPVIVHDRKAHEDTLNLLKKHRPRGVVHCFSGSVETAKEIIKLGMYIGLGGAVTFKNAVKPAEVAAFVPKDRLLLETDAPYMSPVPYRGKRCTSLLIPYTAEKIAAVRGEAVEELSGLLARRHQLGHFEQPEQFERAQPAGRVVQPARQRDREHQQVKHSVPGVSGKSFQRAHMLRQRGRAMTDPPAQAEDRQ